MGIDIYSYVMAIKPHSSFEHTNVDFYVYEQMLL